MNLIRGGRMSPMARRWLIVVIVLLVTGIAVLALWDTSPIRLVGPESVMVRTSRWVRDQLNLGVAGLLVPFVLLWLNRRQSWRETSNKQRQARDRAVMLKRVHNRWITGMLERSLAHEVHIRLGLARRPDVLEQPNVIRRVEEQAEPLPAGTSMSEVFDQLGGGLLILGAPGSGKTTALLELARDLLNQAEADERKPMPVVFNLSSWAAQRPPLAEWLIDELRKRYDIPGSIAKPWMDGGEILPLLDGLDEVAKACRIGCVEAINAFQGKQGPVRFVVCSRTEDYNALVTLLRVEEAVELQTPTRQQVYDYLEAASALAIIVWGVGPPLVWAGVLESGYVDSSSSAPFDR